MTQDKLFFKLAAIDSLLYPRAHLYDDDDNLIALNSTDYEAYFSLVADTELATIALADSTAVARKYITSDTYYEINTGNRTVNLADDVSKLLEVGTLLLVDFELMYVYGCGSWDAVNYCLPVFVIRGWTDSQIVDSTTVHEYTDSTTQAVTQEIQIYYHTDYSDKEEHPKGSKVNLFVIKDATAEIDNTTGDVYYKWEHIPIAPIGRYRGIFTIKHKQTGEFMELPNAYKNGSSRTLVIDIGSYR